MKDKVFIVSLLILSNANAMQLQPICGPISNQSHGSDNFGMLLDDNKIEYVMPSSLFIQLCVQAHCAQSMDKTRLKNLLDKVKNSDLNTIGNIGLTSKDVHYSLLPYISKTNKNKFIINGKKIRLYINKGSYFSEQKISANYDFTFDHCHHTGIMSTFKKLIQENAQ